MKEQHRHLYEVWARFRNRTGVEQAILKTAGKYNCTCLFDSGEINNRLLASDAPFDNSTRYCLKPDYVIPGEVVELKVVESSIRMMKFQAPNGSHWNLDDAQLFKLYFHGYKWADGRISRLLDGPIGEWPICVLWEQE